MLPIRDYEARFQEILEAMDAACEQMEDQDAETLEELNAEFEDALFMLGEIDPKDEGANEELRDALEELDALRADYQKLSMRFSALLEPVRRLEMLIDMAGKNL